MDAALALVVLALLVAVYAVKRVADAHDRTTATLLTELERERERHRDEVAELTNKVQHPSVFQLTPRQADQTVVGPPAEPDEFEHVGQIFEDAAPDDAPPGEVPLPVGEMR